MKRESIMDVPPIVLAHRVVYCSLRLVPLVLALGFLSPYVSQPWGDEHVRWLDRLKTKMEEASTSDDRDRYAREYADTKTAGPEDGGFRLMIASSYMVRALKHVLWAGPIMYVVLWHVLGPSFLKVPLLGFLIRFFCNPAVRHG